MIHARRLVRPDHGPGMVEYAILLGTLALGVVLTLIAIGTQIRTVMIDRPAQEIGEP